MNLSHWMQFWNSLDSVRRVHSDLELASIVFFAMLVFFDVLAHRTDDQPRQRTLGTIGLYFFTVAVLCEFLAYPYGQRNDTLSEQSIRSLDSVARHASEAANSAIADAKRAGDVAADVSVTAGKAKAKADGAQLLAAQDEAKEVEIAKNLAKAGPRSWLLYGVHRENF